MHTERTLRIDAAAIRDATGIAFRPGRLWLHGGRIVAAGGPDLAPPAALAPGGSVEVLDWPAHLVIPALVNAHAHLDLTALGPRAFGGTFLGWVGDVVRDRPRDDRAIAAAVHAGLELSAAAGTGWVGDIAGSEAAVHARLRDAASLPGVAWLECFGIGPAATTGAERADATLARLRDEHGESTRTRGVRIELQPHAPYSAGLPLFERAARSGLPSTHLAETLEEDEFVRRGTGPFADLLRRMALWHDSIAADARDDSPVAHLARVLGAAPWVLAHVNYASDDDLRLLAAAQTVTVAYCPIASEYFGHRDHRYREMLARGIDVCLGTDSILCQPPTADQPLGILPQMRRLWARDGTDAGTLLAMATTNGARALGAEPGAGTLRPGAPARLAAAAFDARDPTDPLEQVLRSGVPLTPLPL
ncbi:MAG: amidohydrolase family protein [Planctomycetes bacterium]|nr:amidohydrolase family protein [Planctomycetota bacterium]